MMMLFMAVLLSISQTLTPIPRQAPDNTASRSQALQKNATRKQNPTPAPPVINPIPPQSNQDASRQPPAKNAQQTVIIREPVSVSVERNWVDCLSVGFTGLLVIIGAIGICAAIRTLKAIEKQAQAAIDADRAWIVAELVPICRRFGNDWHRPVGNGWAPLSEDEILDRDYLKHKLKFTNMGRTPAHILKYQISYTCLDKGVTSLSGAAIARQASARIFDRLLGSVDSIEAPETVDVYEYMREYIGGINGRDNTAVFHGWVEYQHVFSKAEVVEEPFFYVYRPSVLGLERIPQPEKISQPAGDSEKNEDTLPN
jgi:hypothetical protein